MRTRQNMWVRSNSSNTRTAFCEIRSPNHAPPATTNLWHVQNTKSLQKCICSAWQRRRAGPAVARHGPNEKENKIKTKNRFLHSGAPNDPVSTVAVAICVSKQHVELCVCHAAQPSNSLCAYLSNKFPFFFIRTREPRADVPLNSMLSFALTDSQNQNLLLEAESINLNFPSPSSNSQRIYVSF